MKFINNMHDKDSSNDAWEKLYRLVYQDYFASIFDFQTIADIKTSLKFKIYYTKIDEVKKRI